MDKMDKLHEVYEYVWYLNNRYHSLLLCAKTQTPEKLELHDLILEPIKTYPSKSGGTCIVLCAVYTIKVGFVNTLIVPHVDNLYVLAAETLGDNESLFTISQEFFILSTFPKGNYYCYPNHQYYRELQLDENYKAIVNYMPSVSYYNTDAHPGQITYTLNQRGINAAHDVVMLRYLIIKYFQNVTFSQPSEPTKCRIRFYTPELNVLLYSEAERKQSIDSYIDKLRVTKWAMKPTDKHVDIKIPVDLSYIEDCRYSSDVDPYLAISSLYRDCMD